MCVHCKSLDEIEGGERQVVREEDAPQLCFYPCYLEIPWKSKRFLKISFSPFAEIKYVKKSFLLLWLWVYTIHHVGEM